MSRILLLLDHAANRRLLSDALGTRHDVMASAAAEALAEPFDLCVLDGPALDRLWERARARKAAEQPHFLPFLLVTSRQDVGMATRHLWETIDELIFTPIEKVELQARVENLLNARSFSAELERRVEERTAALRASEEQLRLATDGADLGTWHWDIRTGELAWSDRCLAMFGLPPGTPMRYDRFLAVLHPDDRVRADEAVQRAVRERTDYRMEFRCVWPDGSVHWIASLGRAYYDPAGEPVRMEGVALDITPRKQAEAERDRLFNLSLDMLCVAGLDGYLKQLNPAWHRTLGWDDAELLGRPWIEFVHPDDRAQSQQALAQLSGGQPVVGFENRYRCKDDSYRWIAWNAFPLPVEGLAFAVARDVTDHRHAEQALRETQTRLLEAGARAHIGSWELDVRRHRGWWSPQMHRMFGRDPAQEPPAFADFVQIVHPDDRARVHAALQQVIETARRVTLDFRSNPDRGRIRWFTLISDAVRGDDGQVVRLAGTIQDVTEQREAETALRESEARYRQLLEVAPMGVAVHQDGRVVFVNPAGARLIGAASVDDLDGRSIAEIIHPDELEEATTRIQRMLAGEPGLYPVEQRYRRLDGSVIPVEVMAAPLTYAGRPAVQVMVMDVSARKAAEEALRETATGLAAAQARARLGSWELNVATGTGRWSQEMYRLFGCDPVLGPPTIEEFGELIHPDDRPTVVAFHEHIVREGTAGSIEFRSNPARGAVKWFEGKTVGQKAASGEVLRLVGTTQDISERKQSEERLRQAVHEMALLNKMGHLIGSDMALTHVVHAAVDGIAEAVAPDLILFFLREGGNLRLLAEGPSGSRFRHANTPAHRLGECLCGLAARDGRPIYSLDIFCDPRCTWDECKKAGIRSFAALPLKSEDRVLGVLGLAAGSPRDFEAQAPFLETLTAEISGGLRNSILIEDVARHAAELEHEIAQRKLAEAEGERLNAELRRSEVMAAMGSLVAGFAHEVRNPLFGITATLDAMQARFGDRDEYRQYLTVLRGEASRLGSLMNDLLEYGKPHAWELAPGSVDAVVAEAEKGCAPLAQHAGVAIAVHGASRLPVAMDRDRLQRAFENLLQNAVQLSPRGAAVTVDIHDVNRDGTTAVECAIRDCGPGFAEEDLPRIFEPFFSRRKGGTGLGLSIVQRVVEAHGGTVSARNRPEGGAEVTVRLPGVGKDSRAKTRRREAER